MKTILTLFFSLICASTFPQKCDYFKKEKIDTLSGLPVLVQREGREINELGSKDLWLFYSTNRCWIHFNVLYSKDLFSIFSKSDTQIPIVFYFSDSTTLSFLPIYGYRSTVLNPTIRNLMIWGDWNSEESGQSSNMLIYKISKEDIIAFTTKKIEKLKLLKESRLSIYGQKRIMTISKCILEVGFLDPCKCVQK